MILLRRIAALLLAATVLAADQLSKTWILADQNLTTGHVQPILPFLNLVMVWNHGITFGMFQNSGSRIILAAIATCVIAGLFIWLWRSNNWLKSLAIGAISGGAIGNVADRVHYGAVVDFIQAHFGPVYFPYIFNLGDSAICCGVAVLMLESLLHRPLLPPEPASDRKAP